MVSEYALGKPRLNFQTIRKKLRTATFGHRLRRGALEVQTETAPESQVLGIPFARNAHPMWVFDRETLTFLDVNEAAVQQYGYSRREFLRMKIVDIRPPEDVPELLRQTRDLRPKGQSTGANWRHKS